MCKTSLDRGRRRRRRSPLSTGGGDKKAKRRPVGGGYTTHTVTRPWRAVVVCVRVQTRMPRMLNTPCSPSAGAPPGPHHKHYPVTELAVRRLSNLKNNSPRDDQNAIDLKLYCHVAKAHYWGCYVIFYHRHVTLLSLATFIFTYEKCTSSSRIDHKTILSAKLVVQQ